MSLESLFQHILSSELRAEQSRRELRGGEKGRGPWASVLSGRGLGAGGGPRSRGQSSRFRRGLRTWGLRDWRAEPFHLSSSLVGNKQVS